MCALGTNGEKLSDTCRRPRWRRRIARIFPTSVRQLLEVRHRLRGMADHQVELHALPPRRHRVLDRREDVRLGEPLVDDAAQPLRAGLRREGEARLPHPRRPRWRGPPRRRRPGGSAARPTRRGRRAARSPVPPAPPPASGPRSRARGARPPRAPRRRSPAPRCRRTPPRCARAPAGRGSPPGRTGSRARSRAAPRSAAARAPPRRPGPASRAGGPRAQDRHRPREHREREARRAVGRADPRPGGTIVPAGHVDAPRPLGALGRLYHVQAGHVDARHFGRQAPEQPRARRGALRPCAPPVSRWSATTPRISWIASSASPRSTASTNGARGSGFDAHGPPVSTSGSPSRRSAWRSGMPARSSIVSTLVYVSSDWSVKPTTSNSRAARPDSSAYSGTPRSRISRSMSGHGA